MGCAFKERVEAFADGSLLERSRAEVEAHLAGCASCRADLAQERKLASLLGTLREIEPSAGFESAFLRRLRAEAASARPSWRERLFAGWRGLALATAGAAAAVAIGLAVWPRGAETPPPPVSAEVLRDLDLLRNFDAVVSLHALEGVTSEELDAVADMPELGG